MNHAPHDPSSLIRRAGWSAAVGLALACGVRTLAQDADAPATPPAPASTPDAAGAEPGNGAGPTVAPSSMPKVPQPKPEPRRIAPVAGDRVRPAAGNLAGVVWEDDLPPAPRLYPEGTALVERRGRLRVLENGSAVFIFDADEAGEADAPMLLLPCLKLMEIRRTVEARTDQVTLLLSGRLTVSHGRNYLLPEFFSIINPVSESGSEAQSPKSTENNALDTPPPDDDLDPEAQDIIRELGELAPIATGPGVRRSSDAEAPMVAVGAEAVSVASGLRREGDSLISRQGRLIRSGAGSWLFAPETDAPAEADQPMLLLPCLLVEEMEKSAVAQGDRLKYTVSGRIFVYEDRNYLLPTLYLIEGDRGGNLLPAQ